MTPQQWQRIKTIAGNALDMSEPARRHYLGEACGRDEQLRKGVQTLLEADEDLLPFAQTPLVLLLQRFQYGR